MALGDGAAHGELDVFAPAEVPHGGDAGLHGLLRAPQRLERGEGGRIVLERAHRVRLGAQTEMHVAIDETREQGVALEVDPAGARRPRDVHDLSDAALLHHDGAAAHGLRARAVDQGGAHQDE